MPRSAASRELLDVRVVTLSGVALWCARGGRGLRVRRVGAPLLHAPASLLLHIEHNMDHTHNGTIQNITNILLVAVLFIVILF